VKSAADEIKAHRDFLEEAVKKRTAELSLKNLELEEEIQERQKTENTLRVVLRAVEKEKVEIEERVLFNITQQLEPYLNKIEKKGYPQVKMPTWE